MNQTSGYVTKIAIAVGVVAFGIAAWSYLGDVSAPEADSVTPEMPLADPVSTEESREAILTDSSPQEDNSPDPQQQNPQPGGVRVQAILTSKDNYAQILAEEYPKALAGDADAQYLSYKLLEYCRTPAKMFKGMVVGEALEALQARTPAKVDQIETTFARCSDLFEIGVDSFVGWQEMKDHAMSQGQPLALLEEAASTWRFQKNVGDARILIEWALESGDPEAALGAGQLFGITEMAEPAEALAWVLAGCELGAVCGADSSRMTTLCEFSPECVLGEDLPTMITRLSDISPHDVEAATARSKEIVNQLTDPDSEARVHWSDGDEPSGPLDAIQ